MALATVKLSSKGQVVIPKEVRDALHWEPGTELIIVPTSDGVVLKPKPQKGRRNLADLIGMLQHEGPPIPIEELCKPVDYCADWEESEKRSR
jgi:AbrB family looped-hinge helix DNA binding protein